MSAETLREAARLMRERAGRAPASPWDVYETGTHRCIGAKARWGTRRRQVAQATEAWPGSADHIASWHPAVALAVADLLDIVEAGYAEYDPDGPDATSMEFVSAWADNLARAYLGDQP